jgi:hypothetical protein
MPLLLSLPHCLQITESSCPPAQRLVSLQLSAHPLVACCLPWRRPAASGAGQHSVDVTPGSSRLCAYAAHLYKRHTTALAQAVQTAKRELAMCWNTLQNVCLAVRRRTSWRCFLAAVCATFTLSQLSRNAQHGMIGFTGVHTYENKDWLTQLPFILINAGQHGTAHTCWSVQWDSGVTCRVRSDARNSRGCLSDASGGVPGLRAG